MKIGLLNLEWPLRNLALDKIRCYYESQRHHVEEYFPLAHSSYDKIYCSSIFSFTDKSEVPPGAICGGSGFSLKKKLPKEIDAMKPRNNYGFCSRGCPRKCPWCVVPRKEGKPRVEADLYDIWDGKSREVTFFDNNILALPEHFAYVCDQAQHEKVRIDFNQGLDWRLVSEDIMSIMARTKVQRYWRFSWDNIKEDPTPVLNQMKNVYRLPICVYVLVGFNTTEDEDLYRVNTLKYHGMDVFAMNYNCQDNPRLKKFCRWVNRPGIFKTVPWSKYDRL
jgi:hypothetical protein